MSRCVCLHSTEIARIAFSLFSGLGKESKKQKYDLLLFIFSSRIGFLFIFHLFYSEDDALEMHGNVSRGSAESLGPSGFYFEAPSKMVGLLTLSTRHIVKPYFTL